MTAPIVADTGALYAIADRSDNWHRRLKAFLKGNTDPLIVPVTVIPEACYLLNTYLGAQVERQLLVACLQGEMRIETLVMKDVPRILELLDHFRDLNIGFVDASVVALAERLNVTRILTTDRRHFSLFRPRHCATFTLLP